MDTLMPRAQDAQERPTILLHFHHCTWTCRCREAQAEIVLTCMDALMPLTQDAEERPDNLLHFLRPWRSDV